MRKFRRAHGPFLRKGMLQYIPAPNNANGFATSAYNQTLRDDKAGRRVDANTRWGLLSAYYFIDDFNLDNPYPTSAERSQRSRLQCADHGPGAASGAERRPRLSTPPQ